MDIPRTLADFFRRPGMFVQPLNFDTAAAFLLGFDRARDGEILAGFREWLVVKLGYGNNLAWPGLVVCLAYPEPGGRPPVLHSEDQGRLTTLLFENVEAFWRDREAAHGPAVILRRHEDWLRAQDWHHEVAAGQAG